MRLPTTLRWVGLALLGLVIAAAVALGASRLASQQIGIASESVSAGDTLAPPVTPATRRHREKPTEKGPQKEAVKPEASPGSTESGEPTEPAETVEPESAAPAPVEPSSGDDSSVGGDGGGGGGGGPDD